VQRRDRGCRCARRKPIDYAIDGTVRVHLDRTPTVGIGLAWLAVCVSWRRAERACGTVRQQPVLNEGATTAPVDELLPGGAAARCGRTAAGRTRKRVGVELQRIHVGGEPGARRIGTAQPARTRYGALSA